MVNLSKHVLTQTESDVLKRGLNFAAQPKEIPRQEIIVHVECALRQVRDVGAAEKSEHPSPGY